MRTKFLYESAAWDSEAEQALFAFGDKVRVVSGGLHIQRMVGGGHILWIEKQNTWLPLETGTNIELDEDGCGFHPASKG